MFSKKNIKDIPVERTLHATGSRKLLVGKSDTTSLYFEAYTYGYLASGEKWALHKHDNIVEICLVIKGSGVVKDDGGNIENFELDSLQLCCMLHWRDSLKTEEVFKYHTKYDTKRMALRL